jgi:SAM-dependent methyltransferase
VTVYAITPRSNADAIVDCVNLGYLTADMVTLDPTYGEGAFWRRWRPRHLVACDLNPAKSPIGYPVDFTELPWPRCFDAVIFDPPYKLNGTGGSHASDHRFGVDTAGVPWRERLDLAAEGVREAARVLVPGGTLLIKCQDQVASGAVRWQSHDLARVAALAGCPLVDSLIVPNHIGQPPERGCRRCHRTGHERVRVAPVCSNCGGSGWVTTTQHHARRNYSTLLIHRKAGRRR